MTNTKIKISKRDILASGAAALALGPLSALSAKNLDEIFKSDLLSDLDIFSEMASARSVGQYFIEGHPEYANRQTLETHILKKLAYQSQVQSGAQSAALSLRAALASAVSQDFENDLIISVDGWQLSELEVQLCALAATTNVHS